MPAWLGQSSERQRMGDNMRKTIEFALAGLAIALAGCSSTPNGGESTSDELAAEGNELTPRECAAFGNDIEACLDAGCGAVTVVRKGTIENGVCTMQPEREEICVLSKFSTQASEYYTRTVDGTRQVWELDGYHDEEELPGWRLCDSTDLGQRCGCPSPYGTVDPDAGVVPDGSPDAD